MCSKRCDFYSVNDPAVESSAVHSFPFAYVLFAMGEVTTKLIKYRRYFVIYMYIFTFICGVPGIHSSVIIIECSVNKIISFQDVYLAWLSNNNSCFGNAVSCAIIPAAFSPPFVLKPVFSITLESGRDFFHYLLQVVIAKVPPYFNDRPALPPGLDGILIFT